MDLTKFGQEELFSLDLSLSFKEKGYQKVRFSKFDEYTLFDQNRAFLSGESMLTFTDHTGRLYALRPDVTLSVMKKAAADPAEHLKVCYEEDVFRLQSETHEYSSHRQIGAERIEKLSPVDGVEMLQMAQEALMKLPGPTVLSLSHLDLFQKNDWFQAQPQWIQDKVLFLMGRRNTFELKELLEKQCCPEMAEGELLYALTLTGSPEEIRERAEMLPPDMQIRKSADALLALSSRIPSDDLHRIVIDFALVNPLNYYNGLVFQGFAEGISEPVLSGGRYDQLARRFMPQYPGAGAIGFALDMEAARGVWHRKSDVKAKDYLTIALPKGRLSDKVVSLLRKAGHDLSSMDDVGRRLVIEDPKSLLRFLLVKPADVAVYVEKGAADLGVCGKDILEETGADVLEVMDLGFGRCHMAVAAPEGYVEDPSRKLRVATKFEHIARGYYESKGRDAEFIHLNGSIELAPVLGLTDVIVDIVETGSTLKENHLTVLEKFMPISARLVVGRSSYRFKEERIDQLIRELKEVLYE